MELLGASLYPQGLSYTEAMDLGKLAEDQGFDGIFAVEGGLNNDVMATVQAIASATRRLTVGTGIANLYLRHPALLGAGAVAIDELSGGRLILGIGVNNARAVRALGIAWRDPREALRDTTTWLRQTFAGEAPAGIRATLRPARHPIPIHLAGIALETADLAGEIADGLMLYLASKAHFRQLADCMEEGARRVGRQPREVTVSLLIPTFLSDDLRTAREAARRFLTLYVAMPHYARMFRRSGFEAEAEAVVKALEREDQAAVAAAVSDRLMDEVCLVGSLSRCREQLAAFRQAGVGVSDSGAAGGVTRTAWCRGTTFPHVFSCRLIVADVLSNEGRRHERNGIPPAGRRTRLRRTAGQGVSPERNQRIARARLLCLRYGR